MHFRPSVNHAFTNKNRHSMTSRLVAALVAAALSCTALPAAYARTYVAPTASFAASDVSMISRSSAGDQGASRYGKLNA